MSINLIACCDLNAAIGNKGNLLIRLPNDMERFRKLTVQNAIVMGRHTYQEMGEPLPNRTNIVLSKSGNIKHHPDLLIFKSAESILKHYYNHSDEDTNLFICGGSEVYERFIPHADKIYLTIISHRFKQVDTYFPKFALDDFKIIEHKKHMKDDKHPYDYSFVTYQRKNIKEN